MARKIKLTDTRIRRLKAEDIEYMVWDTRIAGFGVRVRPVRAQELRLSSPRGRPIPEVHAWAGSARERRRSPARLYEGLGQDAIGGAGRRL